MPTSRAARGLLALCGLGLLAHGLATVVAPDGPGSVMLFRIVVPLSVLVMALRSVRVRRERWAWFLIAVSHTLWGGAEVFYVQVDGPTFPRISDGMYIACYLATFGALALLIHGRLRARPGARWLDGMIVGATGASLLAALLLGPIMTGEAGVPPIDIVLYPILDLTTLVAIAVPVAMTGWLPGRALGWLTASVAIAAGANLVYAWGDATGRYLEPYLTTAWLAAFVAMAMAAWQPPARGSARVAPLRREGVVPAACGFLAIGLLATADLVALNGFAIFFAAIACFLSGIRAMLLFSQTVKLVTSAQDEARRDQLTGLRNRRALMEDLADVLASGRPHRLAIFDLNGFKAYNDARGHQEGDHLLVRISKRADALVATRGQAYRLGGDEFCVLWPLESGVDMRDLEHAFSDHSTRLPITASHGDIEIPIEAADAETALKTADTRMYAAKATQRMRRAAS